ncbi:MAG: class I SAM-dependent methyltransferase [Oscillospiraceae bacterium]
MSFWDKAAGIYDIAELVNGRVYHAMLEGVKQIVPRGTNVLDCAAGTGELSIAAAEKAESVLCTDMSLSMLEQAKRKCQRKGLDNVFFEERDIFDLDDADNTYDIVIAGNVLHLLDAPEAAVRELYRVTKYGGKLILPTFMLNENSMALVITKLYGLFGFRPHENYNFRSYRRMLENSGCGPFKLTEINGLMPIGFAVMKKI